MNLNRRRFIASMATMTMGGLVAAVAPAQNFVTGKTFKGTADGKILLSADGGQTWQVCLNLAPGCAVKGVTQRGGVSYAEIAIQGYRFTLKSSDGKLWRTA